MILLTVTVAVTVVGREQVGFVFEADRVFAFRVELPHFAEPPFVKSVLLRFFLLRAKFISF